MRVGAISGIRLGHLCGLSIPNTSVRLVPDLEVGVSKPQGVGDKVWLGLVGSQKMLDRVLVGRLIRCNNRKVN